MKHQIKINKREWKYLCNKHKMWCTYNEVKNYTYKEAEEYIKTAHILASI